VCCGETGFADPFCCPATNPVCCSDATNPSYCCPANSVCDGNGGCETTSGRNSHGAADSAPAAGKKRNAGASDTPQLDGVNAREL
jgi:hypothetical protein